MWRTSNEVRHDREVALRPLLRFAAAQPVGDGLKNCHGTRRHPALLDLVNRPGTSRKEMIRLAILTEAPRRAVSRCRAMHPKRAIPRAANTPGPHERTPRRSRCSRAPRAPGYTRADSRALEKSASDIESDPEEMNNLALDPEKNRDMILHMNGLLNDLMTKEVGVNDGRFLPEDARPEMMAN